MLILYIYMTNSYFWYMTYSHSQLIPIVYIYIHTYAYIYILSINISILCLFLLQRLRGHCQDILTLSDLSASERLKELLQKAVSKRVSAHKPKRDPKEIGCMDISTHFWYLLILFVPVGVFKDRTAGYWHLSAASLRSNSPQTVPKPGKKSDRQAGNGRREAQRWH